MKTRALIVFFFLIASVCCADALAAAHFKVDTAQDLQFGSASQCTLRAALLNIANQSTLGTLGAVNPNCPAGQPDNFIEFTFPAGKSGHPEIHLDPSLGRLKHQGHRVVISGVTLDGEHETGLLLVDGNDAHLTIKDAILRSCLAVNPPDDAGGAILYTKGSGLSLTNVRITDCVSATFGGGIAFAGAGDLYMERVYLGNNVSGFGGGLFYFGGVRAFIVDSTIEKNLAVHGAGILADDSPLYLEGSSIRFNAAEQDGGGVYGGALRTRLSEFRGNLANGRGAAIYGGPSLHVEEASFSGNRTGKSGGAIAANGELHVSRTGFDSNLAGERGGAIYLGAAAAKKCISISNSTFAVNSAPSASALWIADVPFAGCVPGMQVVNNTFFKSDGKSQIELADEGGTSTQDILLANTLILGWSALPPGYANCAGRTERFLSAPHGENSNTQLPGSSCDSSLAKIPILDLGMDDVSPSLGGVFEQVYVPESTIAFPDGDAAYCTSPLISNIDQFGNPRKCRQGAVEAAPLFELTPDYTPH